MKQFILGRNPQNGSSIGAWAGTEPVDVGGKRLSESLLANLSLSEGSKICQTAPLMLTEIIHKKSLFKKKKKKKHCSQARNSPTQNSNFLLPPFWHHFSHELNKLDITLSSHFHFLCKATNCWMQLHVDQKGNVLGPHNTTQRGVTNRLIGLNLV